MILERKLEIWDEDIRAVSRATIGRVELTPGSPNTVPGEAVFTIDVRDTDEAVMTELATVTPALHTASLACLRDRYARICPVDEAMYDLDNLRAARTGGTTIVPA